MPQPDPRPEIDGAFLDLRAIAEESGALARHLQDSWPVRVPPRPLSELRSGGLWLPPTPAQPIAGPPTNATFSDLCRHLVNVKTLLFRFRPPPNPAEDVAWLTSRAPVYDAPGLAVALAQIERVCDRLINLFGLRDGFLSIDRQTKAVQMPTLNPLQPWQPPDSQPLPVIDPQDIASLTWAAAKLYEVLGRSPSAQEQAADALAPEDSTSQRDDVIDNSDTAGTGALPPLAHYLMSWREILDALELPNDGESQHRVRALNTQYDGPIILPDKGGQPKVNRDKLLGWWNGLEAKWQDSRQRQVNTQASLQAQHSYGREGTVVPDISGHVQKRRGKRGSR
jgi:hypothetical protein